MLTLCWFKSTSEFYGGIYFATSLPRKLSAIAGSFSFFCKQTNR